MNQLAQKLRDMHALAGNACDPAYNRALLEAAKEIERQQARIADLEEQVLRALGERVTHKTAERP